MAKQDKKKGFENMDLWDFLLASFIFCFFVFVLNFAANVAPALGVAAPATAAQTSVGMGMLAHQTAKGLE